MRVVWGCDRSRKRGNDIPPQVDLDRLLPLLGIEVREHRDELWAPCPHPDHNETRPSWSIANNPVNGHGHGLFKCFGCGFSGNAITLVQVVLGGQLGEVSYAFAKNWIDENNLWLSGTVPLNAELKVVNSSRRKLKVPTGLRDGMIAYWVTAAKVYARSRHITEKQALRWRICYAIDGDLEGRIVFPIRNEKGDWISFHARTFLNHEKRYKNASNEDGFDPGAIFGMEFWPSIAVRKKSTLVLTEGTINSLACERAGAEYIGALGGSDPHPRQLLRLGGWGTIICATDGDAAGDKLAEYLRLNLSMSEVIRAPIPRGEDCDNLPRDVLIDVLSSAGYERTVQD